MVGKLAFLPTELGRFGVMGVGRWYLPNDGLTPYLCSTEVMVLQRIRQILGQTHVHRSLAPYCWIVNPPKLWLLLHQFCMMHPRFDLMVTFHPVN